jgi:hypothetical protein
MTTLGASDAISCTVSTPPHHRVCFTENAQLLSALRARVAREGLIPAGRKNAAITPVALSPPTKFVLTGEIMSIWWLATILSLGCLAFAQQSEKADLRAATNLPRKTRRSTGMGRKKRERHGTQRV